MAKALARAGADVVTITDPRPYARRTPTLAARLSRSPWDVILVGFPGHADVALARAAAALRHRVPVLFDAFASRIETVEDRLGPAASRARVMRSLWEDRLACRLATTVVLDTAAHIDYFGSAFGLPAGKMRQVWVGADDDVMRPAPLPTGPDFRVFVYASFIPLHGLESVVRAAHLLERAGDPVPIDIVGTGATAPTVRQLAERLGVRSVTFLGARPYAELPSLMAASHVCLGIFGTSPKAARVIPNKVFDALAIARPVVTADTPAAREAFTHRHDAWLCPPGDAAALAEALRVLRADDALRRDIADRGHELFLRQFSLEAVSRSLAALVLDSLGARDSV